jgi:hypothetical protein
LPVASLRVSTSIPASGGQSSGEAFLEMIRQQVAGHR